MDILAWQVYLGIAIVLVIAEIFVPGFVLFPIGVGFLLTAVVSLFVDSPMWQLLALAVNVAMALFFIRKYLKRHQQGESLPTNMAHLVGKEVIVIEGIDAEGRGYVKVYGDRWQAVPVDGCVLKVGEKVTICGVEGNKVLVKN